MKKIILMLVAIFSLVACEKDKPTEKDPNEKTEKNNEEKPISTEVKKVPVKITVNYPNIKEDNYIIRRKYDIFFKYDAKGRLEEINDRYFTKGYNIITNFEYNDKNQVIKATERDIRTEVGAGYGPTIVREYSYMNGLLTFMTSDSYYGDIKKKFEYNKDKQLVNYTYDDRGNVKGEEITYDEKNNPFKYLNIPYGTKVSANIGSYEIKQLFFVNNKLSSGNNYVYEYRYDKDNYPIKMIEKHKKSGEVESILTYEYKTLP